MTKAANMMRTLRLWDLTVFRSPKSLVQVSSQPGVGPVVGQVVGVILSESDE